MTRLNLPKNTYYRRNDSFDKKMSVLLQEDFIAEFNKFIQQEDFNLQLLSNELKRLGYAHNKNILRTLKRKLIERGIWKRDGNKECICGFRTDSVGIIGAHRLECPKHLELDKKIDAHYLSEENIINLYNNQDMLPIDIIDLIMNKENLPEDYRSYVYMKVYKRFRELSKAKKIDWSDKAEKVRKANHERCKQTLKEKYGVENASQLDFVKAKKKATSLIRYGTEHPLQNEKIKQKMFRKIAEKYGVENVSQIPEVKEKKKKTYKENFGVDNVFKRLDIVQQSWKDKLGVDNPIKDLDIRSKAIKGLKRANVNVSKLEQECYDYINNIFSELNINYSIEGTKHENNYFINYDENKIHIPDIKVVVSNCTFIFEIQDDYHAYPKLRKNVTDYLYKIWKSDYIRYQYFISQDNTYFFVIWKELDLGKQLDNVKQLIIEILNDNISNYSLYIKDLLSIYQEKFELYEKSKRQVATF